MDKASIAQLLRPAAFPHPVGELLLRETHISWVILCGEFAYKIKKPLDLEFLDFSTLDKRRYYCEQELQLNRRFAPELYLAVVPVTAAAPGPEIDGAGACIDYAVKMRRFDEDQLLDAIAGRDGLDPIRLRALGRELARLHSQLPVCRPDPDGDEPGTPAALQRAMLQNFSQVRAFDLQPPELQQLSALQRGSARALAGLLPVLQQRILDGQVIDGHGDVHVGNIAVVNGEVRLFDCIEFNPAFRIMDRFAEIAFLCMDLDARGYAAEAQQVLAHYLEYSGDYAGLVLLDLYRAYFAMVRAKVNLLREAPGNAALAATDAYADFRRYVSLAQRYFQPRGRFLAITHGVSGTGKSTIAERLLGPSGAVRIRSDVERKRLFGLAPEQRSSTGDKAGLYSAEMSDRTFARLEQLAATILDAGFPVIVDATFLQRKVRRPFQHLARLKSVPFVIIDCLAEPPELRQRLEQRERSGVDASEAGVDIMEQQLEIDEPLAGDELPVRLPATTAQDPALQWQRLQDLCLEQSGD